MQTDETRDRQAALERLMAQYGTALLRYYQGMKVNDVAQALRTTRSGVKHRILNVCLQLAVSISFSRTSPMQAALPR